MPRQSPGIFGARFCPDCGKRVRGPNHLCQPSAIKQKERNAAWMKRSLAAVQAAKAKK